MAKSAVKRLKQDLQQLMDEPIIGANAVPDDTDMFTWYAMVVPPKGSKYADIPVRFVLEFTDKYPNEPPKGFFETDVRYQGGASYMVNNRMSVCLDLFGNFAHIHTEWKSQSSGWSPAYSVHTILLNMQALMESEFISQQPSDVKRTTEAAKKFICAKSGHNGSDPKKWVPHVLRTEKELADFIAERRASGVAPMDVTEEKKAGPNPLRDEYICYVTGSNVHRDSAVLGFGVHVENPRSGILSSPCEYLSLEAFTSGTRNSTTNKQFEYWLPIKVNSELWNEDRFRARIDEIAKGVKLADAKGFPLSFEGNVLRICASLMTSALVEICKNAGEQTANDKFINAFFALYRLMQHVATSDKKNATPAIISLANEKVRTFIENPKDRVKSVCPNLGELLVALIMSDKYSWADLAPSFIDENDTRNVFWYAIGNYNSPAAYPQLADPSKVMGRAQQVFQATETSRNLVLFQVRFCNAAKALSRELLDASFGLPPADLRTHLKQTHKEAAQVKTWDTFFDWLGMPRVSEDTRNKQLVAALARSEAQGYHGGKQNNSGGSRGGGRGGYGGGGYGGRGGYGGGGRQRY